MRSIKFSTPWVILIALALVKIAAHFAVNLQDNFFRDELYYMACGRHLDWGYVDHPPFVGLLAALSNLLWGESVFTLRIFPALAGGAMVILAGLLARELGGKTFAQGLAGLAVLICPSYVAMQGFFSMNAFDQLFWLLAAYLLVLGIKRGEPWIWALFGVALGIGLMNKISMLFFGFGITLGLLFSSERKQFKNPWLWAAAGISILIFLPHIVWQIQYGWPTREFIHNATTIKNNPLTPMQFLWTQFIENHPFLFPLWLAGLIWYLVSKQAKPYRALGWMYLAVLVLLIIQNGKPYYLAPAYSILFASGAVALEKGLEKINFGWLLKPAIWILLIVGGAAFAPFTLNFLPPETFLSYARAMGIESAPAEKHEMGVLPQFFADRYGWPEMAASVAQVYETLTPEEKAKCAILAGNYGEAGAIDYFGKQYGLPNAISTHNSYHLWGPGEATGEIMIAFGVSENDLKEAFEEVVQAGMIAHPLAMPYENNRPIYICRKIKAPLKELWAKGKKYI